MSKRRRRLVAGLVRIRRREIQRAADAKVQTLVHRSPDGVEAWNVETPVRRSWWDRVLTAAARRWGQEGYDLVRHVPIVLWLLLIAYGISLRG